MTFKSEISHFRFFYRSLKTRFSGAIIFKLFPKNSSVYRNFLDLHLYSLKHLKGENIMEQSEYKIGGTTYIVVTTFNTGGESLAELIARLIEKSI